VAKTILFKRGTEANLPDLQEGEPGWAKDTKQFYVGDGSGAPVKVGTEVSDFMDTVSLFLQAQPSVLSARPSLMMPTPLRLLLPSDSMPI
jgi:hypothetical protein